jgi:hypothetical protein
MAILRTMQPAFTAGELSPALWARTDLAKYQSGLKTARNVFVHPHGGVSNRPGLEFIGEVRNSAPGNLLSFVFDAETNQTYNLEFTAGKIRFYRAGVLILSGGLPYEVNTPYTVDHIKDLVFAQENDVMFITHQSYAPRKLSRLADNSWTLTVMTFQPGIAAPTGLSVSAYFQRRSGNIDNRDYKVTAVSASNAESAASVAVNIDVQTENEDGRRIRFDWSNSTGADHYKLYRTDEEIGVVAESDQSEVEILPTQAQGDGATAPLVSMPGAPPAPLFVTASIAYGEEMTYVVAAVSESGEEGLPSAPATARNDLTYKGNRNSLTWNPVVGADSYAVYRLDNGRYGYVGTTETTEFTDKNIVPDLSSAPQQADNPFAGAGDYPSCINFYQQRLAMAGTLNNPAGVWLGQSANYENFSSASPARASDAITFRIRSREKNQVRALVETRGLGIFSSAAEFTVSGATDEVLTPNSINIKKQGNRGSSSLQPIAVGEVSLFARARGGVVQDFSYDFANDAFTGKDLTIMSRHLFEGRKIVSWGYAQAPHSIVWVVFDDGGCVSLTYMREHDVWAWTRHDTDGLFEAVNVVPEAQMDAVYFIIKRAVDGIDKRYIERLHSRSFETSEDAFFVDSGLTYEGSAVTTLSGLDHLVGKTVVALSNGNVVSNLVVNEDGEITLPNATTKAHVGLPYASEIKTLDIDLGAVQGLGTVQGRYKSVASVTLRIEKTRGLWVGPSFDKLTEFKQRAAENWDEATRLATGDEEITLSPDWTKGGTVCIQQNVPLPMTILAIMPDLRVGG